MDGLTNFLTNGLSVKMENEVTVARETLISVILTAIIIFSSFFIIRKIAA